MKISSTLVKLVEHDIQAGNTVFLAGNPGIGKTSITKSIAKNNDSKAFVLSVNLLADKADLTGARLVPTGSTFEQKFFAHHRVREAVEYAEQNPRSTVYLVLDEINRTTPDVTSAALGVSTERELGDQRLPENLAIIVTGNIHGNVVALDDASLSRFVIYEVEADAATLIEWMDSREGGSRPMNPLVKKVLTKIPDCVYERSEPTAYAVTQDDDDDSMELSMSDVLDAGEEMRQLTTPRTIEGISDWLDIVDDDLLRELLQTPAAIGARTNVSELHEVVEAHVGNTVFSQALIGEIADALSSAPTSTPSASMAPPRPGAWDQMRTITTQSELDLFIRGLNEHERSGSIVYAVYDGNDNKDILGHLVAQTQSLEPEHASALMIMLSNRRHNPDNLVAMLDFSGPVPDTVRNSASMLGLV